MNRPPEVDLWVGVDAKYVFVSEFPFSLFTRVKKYKLGTKKANQLLLHAKTYGFEKRPYRKSYNYINYWHIL